MSRPENPPAFLVSSIDGFTQHGMDLRDWFAGQVLPLVWFDAIGGTNLAEIAGNAYAVADAMLSERERQP